MKRNSTEFVNKQASFNKTIMPYPANQQNPLKSVHYSLKQIFFINFILHYVNFTLHLDIFNIHLQKDHYENTLFIPQSIQDIWLDNIFIRICTGWPYGQP